MTIDQKAHYERALIAAILARKRAGWDEDQIKSDLINNDATLDLHDMWNAIVMALASKTLPELEKLSKKKGLSHAPSPSPKL